jgi:hypothetical protein
MAWTPDINMLGLQVSGDIGDVTIYQNKNFKHVTFPKDLHQESASPARVAQRNRFRSAQAQWSSLTDPQKNSLEEACRQLSMPLTGQNLYISTALTNDVPSYQTVANQSGITLPPPPVFVP